MEIFLDKPRINNNIFKCNIILKRTILGTVSMRVPDNVIKYNPDQIDTPIEFTVRSALVDNKLEKNIVVALYKKFKRNIVVKKFNDLHLYEKQSATTDVSIVCKEKSLLMYEGVYFGAKQFYITDNGLVSIKYRFNKKMTPEQLFKIVQDLFNQVMVVEIAKSQKHSEYETIYRGISDENLMKFLSDLCIKPTNHIQSKTPKKPMRAAFMVPQQPYTNPEKPHAKKSYIAPDVIVKNQKIELDVITEKPENLDSVVSAKTTYMTLKPNADLNDAKTKAQKMADNGYCCVKILDSNGVWICTIYPHSSTYHLKKMRDLVQQILDDNNNQR